MGLAGALAAVRPPGRLRVAAVTGIAVLPVLLLAPRWHEPTIRAYLAVALASALGVALVALASPPSRIAVAGRALTVTACGALALVACLAWELVRGTLPWSLLEGIVLGPLRHPGAFFLAPELGPGAVRVAAAGLAAALAFAWAHGHGLTARPSGSTVVGVAELAGGLVLWLGATNRFPLGPLAITPFFWIALAGRRAETGSLGALVLVMVAALQTLHAYPIAGTQVAWGTFLAIPVGGVALADGWCRIREAFGESTVFGTALSRPAGVILGIALAAVTVSGAYTTYRQLEAAYARGVPLGLSGAERIRVPAEQAALYRSLVGTLRARCRTFVTQPGLYSFHLFTGMAPPTGFNATVWMILLSDAQQERIVDRLAASPSPVCALRRQRQVFTTPLARYIEERFVTLFEVEFFEFRIRREPGDPAPA